MYAPKGKRNEKGQTFLSLLLSLIIFGILANAIFTLTTISFRLVSFTRARITARHLAQEKLEIVRNLPFDDVGTIGGIPSGPLPQSENVLRNGLNYTVTTSIVYIDDPFDGSSPDDLLPIDYKRVRIDVAWPGVAASNKAPVVLVSDIAPKGIESAANGGILSILVFDANAVPVPQADVEIVATATNPAIDLALKTNNNGRITLPGSPTCVACYFISVTKPGFSIDRTYSITEIANPNKPHVSSIDGQISEVSFAIDRLSTLEISSLSDRDNNFAPLPNITFNLRGTKTIGTDSDDFPVYKFDSEFTTDFGGKIIIEDVEWDTFDITLPGVSYDIAGTNPITPFSLLPDTAVDLAFALSPNSTHSLLTAFTDSATQAPIASVSATLRLLPTYDQTISSGISADPDFGQAFFEDLTSSTYSLTATASGYIDFSGNLNVSGNAKEKIILTAQ